MVPKRDNKKYHLNQEVRSCIFQIQGEQIEPFHFVSRGTNRAATLKMLRNKYRCNTEVYTQKFPVESHHCLVQTLDQTDSRVLYDRLSSIGHLVKKFVFVTIVQMKSNDLRPLSDPNELFFLESFQSVSAFSTGVDRIGISSKAQ